MEGADILALLQRDPHQGWPLFIKRHTPVLLALIRRGGISRYDDVMDVYVRVCERLTDDNCSRLVAYDPARGPLAAWLAVVVRRVAVDWVRSRAGRRRHFGALERLTAFDRQVFELRYWHRCDAAETQGLLESKLGRPVAVDEVDDALTRVERALTPRHRIELANTASRVEPVVALETPDREEPLPVPDPRPDPEHRLLQMEATSFVRSCVRRARGLESGAGPVDRSQSIRRLRRLARGYAAGQARSPRTAAPAATRSAGF
jgi:DNA-directed RNA polymerase specialized sigma24 family protein